MRHSSAEILSWADDAWQLGRDAAEAHRGLSESSRPDFRPDLSGEWADSPTPKSVVEAVTELSYENVNEEIIEAICNAWEEGANSAWPHG